MISSIERGASGSVFQGGIGLTRGVADLFCGLWRALCRLYELEWRVLWRMEMFEFGRAGSGGWMLPDM